MNMWINTIDIGINLKHKMSVKYVAKDQAHSRRENCIYYLKVNWVLPLSTIVQITEGDVGELESKAPTYIPEATCHEQLSV